MNKKKIKQKKKLGNINKTNMNNTSNSVFGNVTPVQND